MPAPLATCVPSGFFGSLCGPEVGELSAEDLRVEGEAKGVVLGGRPLQPSGGSQLLEVLPGPSSLCLQSSSADVLEPMDLNQSPGWDIVYLSWVFLY